MAEKKATLKSLCKYLGNVIFHNLVICVFVVVFWQGTWTVLDLYLLPSDPMLSASVSVGMGIFLSFVATLLQSVLRKTFISKDQATFILASRMYTYIMGWVYVLLWRGVWNLLDIATGITLVSAAVCLVASIVLLTLMKSLKSTLAAPINVDFDTDRIKYFRVLTRFTVSTERPFLYLCDAIVTSIVISPSVVVFWRGAWTIFDLILPSTPFSTVIYSLVIFICCETPFIPLQHQYIRFLYWAERNKLNVLRLFVDDVVSVYLGITCVIGWRCVWKCLSHYYLSDHIKVAAWSAHIIGYLTLTAHLVSNSMLARGCKLDGVIYQLYMRDTLQRICAFCRSTQHSDTKDSCTDTKNEGEVSKSVILHL